MIRNIFAGAAMLALGACATADGAATAGVPMTTPVASVSDAAVQDPDAYAALFAEETRAARAMIDAGNFSVRCSADGRQWVFQVGGRQASTPFECGELIYVPTLVRRKVMTDGSSLLMVIGSGMGVLSDGMILREDPRSPTPLVAIPIENMWLYGPILSKDRLVLITGEVSPTGCGLIRHDRELTIDWRGRRIASGREIPSPPLTCAETAG